MRAFETQGVDDAEHLGLGQTAIADCTNSQLAHA